MKHRFWEGKFPHTGRADMEDPGQMRTRETDLPKDQEKPWLYLPGPNFDSTVSSEQTPLLPIGNFHKRAKRPGGRRPFHLRPRRPHAEAVPFRCCARAGFHAVSTSNCRSPTLFSLCFGEGFCDCSLFLYSLPGLEPHILLSASWGVYHHTQLTALSNPSFFPCRSGWAAQRPPYPVIQSIIQVWAFLHGLSSQTTISL